MQLNVLPKMNLLTQQQSTSQLSLYLLKIYASSIAVSRLLSVGMTDVASLIQDLASIIGARLKTHCFNTFIDITIHL